MLNQTTQQSQLTRTHKRIVAKCCTNQLLIFVLFVNNFFRLQQESNLNRRSTRRAH